MPPWPPHATMVIWMAVPSSRCLVACLWACWNDVRCWRGFCFCLLFIVHCSLFVVLVSVTCILLLVAVACLVCRMVVFQLKGNSKQKWETQEEPQLGHCKAAAMLEMKLGWRLLLLQKTPVSPRVCRLLSAGKSKDTFACTSQNLPCSLLVTTTNSVVEHRLEASQRST